MADAQDDRPLLIVGGGRMGEALLGGLIAAGREPAALAVAEVFAPRRAQLETRVPRRHGRGGAGRRPTRAVLAVKPGDVARPRRPPRPRAARGCCRSPRASRRARSRPPPAGRCRSCARCRTRPRSSGRGPRRSAGAPRPARTTWPGREADPRRGRRRRARERGRPDAVTGLSGSGPAYVFLVAEAMAEAGVLGGLPRDIAETLASQTLLGSARLLVDGDTAPRRCGPLSPPRRHDRRRACVSSAPWRPLGVPRRCDGRRERSRELAASLSDPRSRRLRTWTRSS